MTISSFDWTQTLKRVQGNETVAKKIVAMFFDELPEIQAAVNHAYKENNNEDLYAHLHKLKGSCSFIEVPVLSEITTRFCEAAQHKETEKYKSFLKLFNDAVNLVMECKKNALT